MSKVSNKVLVHISLGFSISFIFTVFCTCSRKHQLTQNQVLLDFSWNVQLLLLSRCNSLFLVVLLLLASAVCVCVQLLVAPLHPFCLGTLLASSPFVPFLRGLVPAGFIFGWICRETRRLVVTR